MHKSQLEVDHNWPGPLMRTRSGKSRDNKKVSCETLSKVDWYSRRPYEAQLYYHSDGDEEENPASEAEDDHENKGEDDKEERADAAKLESHAYGENLSAQGHHFLACFHAQGSSAMAISSPGRDGQKTERVPRTYPSPIPHSGSLLPNSGRLLPHSGPIKLHVGTHANSHANSKASGSIRGSSLIPSNIAGKSSKSSGFGNANEPSSPKVTCLGRVKIKQKYCREMGKLADMASGASNDKVHKSIGDQMMRFARRKNKAHTEEEETVLKEEMQKPLPKVPDKVHREHGQRADKARDLTAAGATTELKKSWHGLSLHGEEILQTDAAIPDSESKGQKGKWRLKEQGVRMKFRSSHKKSKQQPPDALGTQFSLSQADCAIDLNRFCSSDEPHMGDERLSKSLENLSFGDESLQIEQVDDAEFVPQAPPPNSLLLMRNSKSRGACAALAASSTCRRRGMETFEEGATLVDKEVHPSSLQDGDQSLKQLPSFLLGVDKKDGEFAKTVNGHEETPSFAEMKVKKLCTVVLAECMPLQVETNVLAQCQVSPPKTPPEATSLWQRRSIMKPSALYVGKPVTLQVKQPTTR